MVASHYQDMLSVVHDALREDDEREVARKIVAQRREYNSDGYCFDPTTGEACDGSTTL